MTKWNKVVRRWGVLVLCVLCSMAGAQDTVTTTNADGFITQLTYEWTSASDGTATGRTDAVVPGMLYRCTTTPDTVDVPTDNYDIEVYAAHKLVGGSTISRTGSDISAGLLANRDSVNVETVEFWPGTVVHSGGFIQFEITNAGNAKTGRISFYMYRTLKVEVSGAGGVAFGGASAQLLQHSGSGQTKWITMSGDATIADGGAVDVPFVDQDVTSGSTPTLTATNITGVPAANVLAGTFGTGDYVMDSGLIVNEGGGDNDTRIESDVSPFAFFVQASNGFIGIRTGTPESPLHVKIGDVGSDPVSGFAQPNLLVESDSTASVFVTGEIAARFYLYDEGGIADRRLIQFTNQSETTFFRPLLDNLDAGPGGWTMDNVTGEVNFLTDTGIGDSTPDATLDVNGTLIVEGLATFNAAVKLNTPITFVLNDATPTVAAGNVFIINSSSTTDMTDLDDGLQGQMVIIRASTANVDVIDGGNLKLAGNWTPDADDTITLIFNLVWYETSRSAN